MSGFSLTEADGPSCEHYHAGRKSRWLVVCDHARNKIPLCLGNLGLAPEVMEQHIAYDVGAEGVARQLADLLQCPALLHGFCRLVVDPNNQPDTPGIMREIACDGTEIPGNRNLSAAHKQARLDALFRPYHRAIADAMAAIRARGELPLLVSVHSCTPELNGHQRPWHIGVLWNQDGRLALPVMKSLEAAGDIRVGDNQPYSAQETRFYTTSVHAEDLGTPSVLLEIRHDVIATPEQQKVWARRIFSALPESV